LEQGETLRRVKLHAIKARSSDIKPWEDSMWLNFDFYMGETTEGEILRLIFGGLYERLSV
jgi:hypothetical protein